MGDENRVQDLYERCLQWFLANFRNGQHGSLQILYQDVDGELGMLKVQAESDEEMYEFSRSQLGDLNARRFVGLGEGQIMTSRGAVPIFIMYYQEPDDPQVRGAVAPYRRSQSDEFEIGQWEQVSWIEESWLT